jgi:hypothetical protein
MICPSPSVRTCKDALAPAKTRLYSLRTSVMSSKFCSSCAQKRLLSCFLLDASNPTSKVLATCASCRATKARGRPYSHWILIYKLKGASHGLQRHLHVRKPLSLLPIHPNHVRKPLSLLPIHPNHVCKPLSLYLRPLLYNLKHRASFLPTNGGIYKVLIPQ